MKKYISVLLILILLLTGFPVSIGDNTDILGVSPTETFAYNESCPTHGRLVDEGESQSYYGCSVCGGTGKIISVTGENTMAKGSGEIVRYNVTFNGITYDEVHFRCYNCGVVPKSQSETWNNVIIAKKKDFYAGAIIDTKKDGPKTAGPGKVPVRWCADCYPTLKSQGKTWYSVASYEVPHLPPMYKLTIIDKVGTTKATRSTVSYDKGASVSAAASIPAGYVIDTITCSDSSFSINQTSGNVYGAIKSNTTITYVYKEKPKQAVTFTVKDKKSGQTATTRSGYPVKMHVGDSIAVAPNPPVGYEYSSCSCSTLNVDSYGNVTGELQKNTVVTFVYKPKPTPTPPPTKTPVKYNVIIKDRYGSANAVRRSSASYNAGSAFSCAPATKTGYVFESCSISGTGVSDIGNGNVTGTVQSKIVITYTYKKKEADDCTITIKCFVKDSSASSYPSDPYSTTTVTTKKNLSFSDSAGSLTGYTFNRASTNVPGLSVSGSRVSGKVQGSGTIRYYYIKNANTYSLTVIDNYGGNSEYRSGYPKGGYKKGSSVSVSAKARTGYVYSSIQTSGGNLTVYDSKKSVSGKFTDGDITITINYTTKPGVATPTPKPGATPKPTKEPTPIPLPTPTPAPNPPSIIYHPNGGNGSSVYTSSNYIDLGEGNYSYYFTTAQNPYTFPCSVKNTDITEREFAGWARDEKGITGLIPEGVTVYPYGSYENYYAIWSYYIIFDANGGTTDLTTLPVIPGSTRNNTVSVPARTGYLFEGWYSSPEGGLMVYDKNGRWADNYWYNGKWNNRYDLEVYAHWKPCSYTIEFRGPGQMESYPMYYDIPRQLPKNELGYYKLVTYNDGTNGSSPPAYVSSLIENTQAKSIFHGWATVENGAPVYMDEAVVENLSAKDGDVVPLYALLSDGYVILPTAARIGYEFKGWKRGDTFIGYSGEQYDPVTDHDTLTAIWDPKKFILSFDSNGGTEFASREIIYNTTFGDLPEPVKEGYVFSGWYTAELNDNGVGQRIVSTTKKTTLGNMTIYAAWLPEEYPITFDANGGSVAITQKMVRYDFAYGELPVPTREGYFFTGWYDGDTEITNSTKVIRMEPHTLKAKWRLNKYTISFDPNGGTVSPTGKTVEYLSNYGELPVPVYEGWTFDGWYYQGNKVSSLDIMNKTYNHTLIARWIPKQYTIHLNYDFYGADNPKIDGTSVTFDTQGEIHRAYGDKYGELTTPSRDGYIFLGWFYNETRVLADTFVEVAEDHALIAKWEPRRYTIHLHYRMDYSSGMEKSIINKQAEFYNLAGIPRT